MSQDESLSLQARVKKKGSIVNEMHNAHMNQTRKMEHFLIALSCFLSFESVKYVLIMHSPILTKAELVYSVCLVVVALNTQEARSFRKESYYHWSFVCFLRRVVRRWSAWYQAPPPTSTTSSKPHLWCTTAN